MPNLQERVAFREGDHSESATAPLCGALAGHTEADDLRSKLGVALKRLGRDTQQQRKMREQIAELRKMLSNAGVTPPDQDEDDEDDGDDGDSDAWVAEDDAKPESPQPRRRLRRGQGRRILSRSDTSHHLGVPPPTAEWVDTSMGDDSVIIKEPPLDPSLADLLSGAPPAAHASRADVPAGLGSELDAGGYHVKPDMFDADTMTDAHPAEAELERVRTAFAAEMHALRTEHQAALARMQTEHKDALGAKAAEHAAAMDTLRHEHAAALERMREEAARSDAARTSREAEHADVLERTKAEHADVLASQRA